MGYDDENLEPKAKSKNKNSKIDGINKYLITYKEDKREVKGNTYEELVQNIKEKFNINSNDQFKIEYWSTKYQEWLLMESLPENESKLQLNFEKIETHSFVDDLNSTFRKYIETDDPEYLKLFEVAVIYACKRREQKQYIDIEDFVLKNVEHQQLVKQLSDEMKKFQHANKQFKLQLESLSNKIGNLESNSNITCKKKNRNNKCIII